MPKQLAQERAHNFREVALGYQVQHALAESRRCLQCKVPKCTEGCPVGVDIPRFIKKIVEEDFEGAEREHPDCLAVVWPADKAVGRAAGKTISLPPSLAPDAFRYRR